MGRLQVVDARSQETRDIDTSRVGKARMDDFNGRRLIHIEVRRDAAPDDVIPVENGAQNFIEQLICEAPGAEGIAQFSPDPGIGLLRRSLSWMVFGMGWSEERVKALVDFALAEVKQLR